MSIKKQDISTLKEKQEITLNLEPWTPKPGDVIGFYRIVPGYNYYIKVNYPFPVKLEIIKGEVCIVVAESDEELSQTGAPKMVKDASITVAILKQSEQYCIYISSRPLYVNMQDMSLTVGYISMCSPDTACSNAVGQSAAAASDDGSEAVYDLYMLVTRESGYRTSADQYHFRVKTSASQITSP